MIKAKDIHDIDHIKELLNNIKTYVTAYIGIKDLTEEEIEDVNLQLCEIDEFIIGTQKSNDANWIDADIRMMIYWQYINGQYEFLDMIGELRNNEGEV